MKNDNNILPLDKNKVKNIAVLGKQASTRVIYAGDGSGRVRASFLSVPLTSLKNFYGIPTPEKKCDSSKFEDNTDYL